MKKFNLKYFRYYVSMLEMEYIDMTKWTIVIQDENESLLECELKNAFDNVMDGFY